MLILFPSDYFDIKKVDSDYVQEYEAVAKLSGLNIILFNYDEFVSGMTIKVFPNASYTGQCIYRGWMLTPAQYKTLYDFLLNPSFG